MKAQPIRTQEEHEQVLQAMIYALISTSREFADYTLKFELYETLTANEVQLMNQIAIAVQEYLDIEELKTAKERQSNGNLGQ